MARVRTYHFTDKFALKKMVSLLNATSEVENERVLPFFLFRFLHWLLPISLKFLPEAYTAIEDDRKIAGLIVLKPNNGNWKKWKIKKLILTENANLSGRQLVDYVVTRYGACGVNTFIVNVDTTQQEVLDLFANGCGFKFCASEQLWQLKHIRLSTPKLKDYIFRPFKNSDALEVCNLYNNSIHPQYRNSLCKSKYEFYNTFFYWFEKNTSFKYVIQNNKQNIISGYILIKTEDNFNFLVELSLLDIHNEDFAEIIGFAINKICKRVKNFNVFIINKKYKQNATLFEKYLLDNEYELKQNQSVLVKDYFKRIPQEQQFAPAIIFTNIKGKPALAEKF